MRRDPRARAWILAAALGLAPILAAPAYAELVAERITAENFDSRQIGGPDADAGVDDWFLGNGTICAAISDPGHESPLTPSGGVLIDLGHCGAGDDQWTVLQPLLNLSQKELVPIEQVLAGRDEKSAWIRTQARYNGVEVLTTYTLDSAEPSALAVSIRARRVEAGARLFAVGAITLHASGQLSSFALTRANLATSRGFVHPPSDRSSTSKLLASLDAADLTVLVGAEGWPPISYGIEQIGAAVDENGKRSAISTFTITGNHYTLQNALAKPPWIGSASGTPSVLQMLQIPFMDLEPETVLSLDYRIWVGERADVASITDRIFASAPRVHGRVDDPAARIHFSLESGAPISEVMPDAKGEFSLHLPRGRYRAEARAPAGRWALKDFEVPVDLPTATATASGASGAHGEIALADLALGTPGRVELPANFIGRLVFLRADGSGPVHFGENGLGFTIGDKPVPAGIEADALNLAGSSSAPRRVEVPPGAYRVVAVRGPEYAAREVELVVRAGEVSKLALEPLPHVAPTPGYLAADLHVHSGQSYDSSLPERLQIEAFAAIGAEVLVSTEHDRIFDPSPAIAASGLAGELVGLVGSELTSSFPGGDSPYTSGHLNVFPLRVEPKAYRRGAFRIEGRRLRDFLVDVRAAPTAPFVQINHPRPDLRGDDIDTYFDHLGVAGEPLDPKKPLSAWPNSVLIEKSPNHGGRDLDVDGVELMNAEDLHRYRRIRADWLSFLLQGERLVATANSDSHRLGHVVGLPRTYVRVEDDRIEAFDEAAFMASLRQGRAFGSTGPLFTVHLAEAGLGEIHSGSKGVLEISVHGADWVPISEWRAYVNGELVHRAPIARGESASLPLAFAADSFVTVEVEGPAEGIYREVLPGFVPFAFSNPIFVDVDGNGRYDAPGLPAVLPAAIANPDATD